MCIFIKTEKNPYICNKHKTKNMDSSTVYFENCNDYLQQIISIISFDELKKLSKEYDFIKRERTLNLKNSISLLAYAAQNIGKATLTEYASFIEKISEKSISKQSVAKHFSANLVAFTKALLERVISKQIQIKTNKPSKFKKIMLIDSTGFEVCSKFKPFFEGSGGGGTGSSLKIQYAFDLLSGCISMFDITNGITPDYNYSLKQNIEKDCLYLQDLGYFTIAGFQKIQAEGGYFISKYNTSCNLYSSQKKGDKVDFIAFVAMFLTFNQKSSSGNYYLSSKPNHRLEVRLVIFSVPKEVSEARLTKRKKKGKKKSKPSEKTIANSKVSIYITNVPEDILSDEQIKSIYRLRWAIELTFKTWKSTFNLAEIKQMSLNRFLGLFYFKLILLLIGLNVVTSIIKEAKNNDLYLSPQSCCSIFKAHFANDFYKYILEKNQNELTHLITKMKIFMLKHCKIARNKKRISSTDIINSITLEKPQPLN